MRRPVAITLILIVAATACASTAGDSTVRTIEGGPHDAASEVSAPAARPAARPATVAAPQARSGSALETFDDCDSLLGHIRTEALSRVDAYGLDHGQYSRSSRRDGFPDGHADDDLARGADDKFARELEFLDGFMDGANDDMDSAADMAAEAMGGAGGTDYSGTNVQVIGVDEPDIVKTDGRRIIAMSKGVLTVLDVSGTEPNVAGHVVLDEAPGGELLLHGDRALVVRNHSGSIRPDAEIGDRNGRTTEIVVIDELLLDGVPRRGRSMRVEGRYVSSRSIGATARIVINSFPDDPGFVRPLNRAGTSVAADVNRQVVEQSTLSDWLPDYTLVDADGSVLEQTERFLSCDRVHVPGEFSGFGTASILTVDLDEPLAPDGGAATFAAAGTVYASLQNLYVATSAWVPTSVLADSAFSTDAGERYATSIHKFSLGVDASAAYEASGSVEGHLLNQFALHERDGHLFVAVTEGPPRRFWGAESRIVALRQQGEGLVEVGRVGDMGRGERIYAVRYIADRAYVVTFREVDPLYVVDLSDPTQPAVLGELKIPGFSSYLHPIGDGLLVGVGRDVTEWGRDIGLKISLFDVSDASDPREIDTWTRAEVHTDIGADHRSFLWWEPERLLVVPLFAYWRNRPNRALAFEVTRSGGLTERGAVDHSPASEEISTECHHEFDSAVVDEVTDWKEIWGTTLLLVCKPGQEPNAVGYVCSHWSTGAFAARINADSLPVAVNDDDRILRCRPESGEPLRRSLVIGEDLWTMSSSLLQRNDLGTLLRGDRVPLPEAGELPPSRPRMQPESASVDRDSPPETGTDEVSPPPTVARFADCSGLLQHIRTEASNRVGAYGFDHGGFGRLPVRSGSGGSPDTGASRLLAVSDDGLHDFIDTDGRRIVTTVGDTLTVVDVTGAEPSVMARLPLDLDRTVRLITHGNRTLVIGEKRASRSQPGSTSSAGEFFDITVVVREFLTDGEPRPGRSLHIEGRLVAARSGEGAARVVVRSTPKDLGLVFAATDAGERFATAANRRTIEQSTIGNWLPGYALVSARGTLLAQGRLVPCEEVVTPSEFSGVGIVSALTLDLDRSITAGATAAIFGEDVAAFATDESLYVATEPWPAPSGDGRGSRGATAGAPDRTSVHRFSLSHWWRAAYEASGSIAGKLLGPSPLHEHDEHLFAAIEVGSSDSEREHGEQRIVSLRQQEDRIVEVGRSDDIGDDASIGVVRYVDDLAFARPANGRRPVRVVDLGDPERPVSGGELSKPSHDDHRVVLQPVGNDRLATVESSRPGWRATTKVSLYEASEGGFRETVSWTLGGVSSTATSDSNRLGWLDEERLLVVPVAERHGGIQPHGAALFHVSPAGDMSYVGHVSPVVRLHELVTDCVHEFGDPYAGGISSDSVLLVCRPGQRVHDTPTNECREICTKLSGDPPAYHCHEIPVEEARDRDIGVDRLAVPVGDDDHIGLCWPLERGHVFRSLAIIDELWTLSASYSDEDRKIHWLLQSNALDTLGRRAAVVLND